MIYEFSPVVARLKDDSPLYGSSLIEYVSIVLSRL